MKSAYEVAMERAERIYADDEGDNSLEIRENLKKVMAPFFKGDMDPEGLWHELKDEDEAVLVEAQLMLIESIGLRNSSEQIERRKEAVVAVESLKDTENSSFFEKSFTQAQSLQQQYQTQKNKLDQQVQQHLDNSQAQGLSAQAAANGGQEQGMNGQMRQQLAKKLSEFQKSYNQRFDKLIEKMKAELK
ncbi:hypothetical protein [Halanaerobium hydrogeniformans]|uniref:Uncharacterized protein n=1 Tax=Halanaerobium hydrogeniformans TaxID=656519 RepID=E4RMZ8_HALHG|nr:hypothetical protein [Halanaerobium hydrogeniformans]ADQ14215.1 hypothetical protein Halsa_0767 [Halanaerobium hydrogeniformans]